MTGCHAIPSTEISRAKTRDPDFADQRFFYYHYCAHTSKFILYTFGMWITTTTTAWADYSPRRDDALNIYRRSNSYIFFIILCYIPRSLTSKPACDVIEMLCKIRALLPCYNNNDNALMYIQYANDNAVVKIFNHVSPRYVYEYTTFTVNEYMYRVSQWNLYTAISPM